MASEGEDRSLYKEAFRQQMEAIKGELHSKSTEVESLKARNKELEDVQMRQEDTINALKRQNKKVCVSFFFFYVFLNLDMVTICITISMLNCIYMSYFHFFIGRIRRTTKMC